MDRIKLHIDGHVLITDPVTGEILVNKRNAIHKENMSNAIARSLAANAGYNGFIQSLSFGNGGVVIDGNGNVTYNELNVSRITDKLHNEIFSKIVSNSEIDDSENNITVIHSDDTGYSYVVITCTLDYNEPSGQDLYDDSSDLENDFIFDELGLISQDGKLLTHLIFHPVQKSSNRKIQVRYTLQVLIG